MSPIARDGLLVHLHHLLQREPGPMVELPETLHQRYHKQLHGLVEDGRSFRGSPELEKQYDNMRNDYWEKRAAELISADQK